MSSSGPQREVAYRVFADEFDDSYYTYAESDEERAPNYLVTPTGARVNRLFVVGVLTEVEDVSDDVVRARVVDPTGAFVIYAGQYQPEALAFFERASPPAFVALTGKARTFQPEGSDRVFTSIRPETVNEVDAETRDRWVVQTAEHTLERVAIFGKALSHPASGTDLQRVLETAGVQPGVAAGIPRAIEEYGTTQHYLSTIQEMAIDAARVVAGETDAVEREPVAPDETGEATVDAGFADDVALEGVEVAEQEPREDESAGSPATQDTGQVVETGREETGEEEIEGEETGREETGEEEIEREEETGEESQPEGRVEEGEGGSGEPAPVDSGGEESQAVGSEAGHPPAEPDDADLGAPQNGEREEVERTDEMYELSEEERAEVEEKFDVGFESGAEIDVPGDEEAVEEPDAEATGGTESVAEAAVDDESTSGTEEAEEDAEKTAGTEATADSPDAATLSDDELEDVVVETMKAEGDEDGISRSVLMESVMEAYDVDESAVEDAIQDALLGGRCFESGEDTLKPI